MASPSNGSSSARGGGHSSSTCILPKSGGDLDATANWDVVAAPVEALLAASVDQRAKVINSGMTRKPSACLRFCFHISSSFLKVTNIKRLFKRPMRRESTHSTHLLGEIPPEVELTDYRRLSSSNCESPTGLLHGEDFKAELIPDLDIFFERLYEYFCAKESRCIITNWAVGVTNISQGKTDIKSETDQEVEAKKTENEVYRKVIEEDLNLEPLCDKDKKYDYLWNCKDYFDLILRLILATDNDGPGQVLAEELARRLGKERCWRVRWPKKNDTDTCKDANEVLMFLGPQALRKVIEDA